MELAGRQSARIDAAKFAELCSGMELGVASLVAMLSLGIGLQELVRRAGSKERGSLIRCTCTREQIVRGGEVDEAVAAAMRLTGSGASRRNENGDGDHAQGTRRDAKCAGSFSGAAIHRRFAIRRCGTRVWNRECASLGQRHGTIRFAAGFVFLSNDAGRSHSSQGPRAANGRRRQNAACKFNRTKKSRCAIPRKRRFLLPGISSGPTWPLTDEFGVGFTTEASETKVKIVGIVETNKWDPEAAEVCASTFRWGSSKN